MSLSHAQLQAKAAKLIEAAREAGRTIVTAESCTGGGIGQIMTSVPGSSRVFLGGVIAYANQVKERQLFVSEQTLIDHGAVSSQTATAMAENVRLLMGADLGVSVTGIAGPGGGTAQKPVGLVYAGLSTGAGTHAKKFEFTGHDRDSVRALTISAALDLLRDGLINPEP